LTQNEKTDNAYFKNIVRQNEIIISLLGRLAFKPEELRKAIKHKKRNPENYLNGYNACNGKNSVSQIAEIIGVTEGTLSPILSDWEEKCWIYEIEKPNGKFYKKIMSI